MKEIDPGHEYLLDSYDGGESVRLVFVKREGEGYPFNMGHHPGTNCQEVIRVLIARVQYLQRQIPCDENVIVIDRLRDALWQFEMRAAERHGRQLPPFRADVETFPTCAGCGHVGCVGEGHRTSNHALAASTPSVRAAARKAALKVAEEIIEYGESVDWGRGKQPMYALEIAEIVSRHCSPVTEGEGDEGRLCLKCGHEERFSDNEGGTCEKIVDEEAHFCNCVCSFG